MTAMSASGVPRSNQAAPSRKGALGVRIVCLIRPELPPCHTAILRVPATQTRLQDVLIAAWSDLLAERERIGNELWGPLPSLDVSDYCLRFLDPTVYDRYLAAVAANTTRQTLADDRAAIGGVGNAAGGQRTTNSVDGAGEGGLDIVSESDGEDDDHISDDGDGGGGGASSSSGPSSDHHRRSSHAAVAISGGGESNGGLAVAELLERVLKRPSVTQHRGDTRKQQAGHHHHPTLRLGADCPPNALLSRLAKHGGGGGATQHSRLLSDAFHTTPLNLASVHAGSNGGSADVAADGGGVASAGTTIQATFALVLRDMFLLVEALEASEHATRAAVTEIFFQSWNRLYAYGKKQEAEDALPKQALRLKQRDERIAFESREAVARSAIDAARLQFAERQLTAFQATFKSLVGDMVVQYTKMTALRERLRNDMQKHAPSK